MGLKQWLETRLDGWANLLTGVGSHRGRAGFSFHAMGRLPDQALEDLYHGDGLASVICRTVPVHALRQGFVVQTPDPAQSTAVMETLKRLGAREKLLEAWVWAYVFGGGAVFVGADDGRDPSEPLDWQNLAAVRFLTVLDKRELVPLRWYLDPMSPKFGEPELYLLQRIGQGNVDTRKVHETRLLRFTGQLTTRRRRLQNWGWGESELQRVYDKLRAFNGAFASVEALLHDASQAVFKMPDLAGKLTADNRDAFKVRMEFMDLTRSAARAVMIGDDEEFTRTESQALAGLPDTLDRFMLALSGVSEIPVTILMKQSPAGLNATGDSDIRQFYDRVQSERTNYLLPRLEMLLRMIFRSEEGPTDGVKPVGWSVEFPSLWQLSPKEEADRRYSVAQADVAYITAGVLTPEEVSTSRFREEGWSPETQVDLDGRRQMQQADRDAATGQPSQLPKPAPQAPTKVLTPGGAAKPSPSTAGGTTKP